MNMCVPSNMKVLGLLEIDNNRLVPMLTLLLLLERKAGARASSGLLIAACYIACIS